MMEKLKFEGTPVPWVPDYEERKYPYKSTGGIIMTREIKFRGKRLDNGEWAYGDLIQNPENTSIYWTEPYCGTWQDKKVKVDPETVGQYTGLIDKAREKIFEGDIILFSGIEFEISYSDGCFWFSNEEETMELHSILGMGDIEIIGNIHDNPELAKGGNE